jgi:hypothetical protein
VDATRDALRACNYYLQDNKKRIHMKNLLNLSSFVGVFFLFQKQELVVNFKTNQISLKKVHAPFFYNQVDAPYEKCELFLKKIVRPHYFCNRQTLWWCG